MLNADSIREGVKDNKISMRQYETWLAFFWRREAKKTNKQKILLTKLWANLNHGEDILYQKLFKLKKINKQGTRVTNTNG